MGLFNGLFSLAIDTIKLPISIVQDVAETVVEGESDEHIEENLKDMLQDIEEIFD